MIRTIVLLLTTIALTGPAVADENRKVRALMVTGGCCHDYQNQKRLISEGLSKRVGPIDWTILEYSDKREVKADVYKQKEWIKDFDIVIHNECFGGVTDGEFVKAIVNAHTENNVPAIMVHCSMHSYRNAPTADAWRSLLGVTSRRHERKETPTRRSNNRPRQITSHHADSRRLFPNTQRRALHHRKGLARYKSPGPSPQ